MPIDRATTLRNADTYLKQGKLDLAIAEYLRVIEDQPRDWTTANALGDLYVRAGQIDNAIEQFSRIADNFAAEGFLPKASALYKKILKLKPGHEHALVQAADIAAAQGLFVDARGYLKTIADRRRASGDDRGVAEIEVRLGTLDPADYPARIAAAQARARLGEIDAAIADLKALATELSDKTRVADAAEALRAAVQLAPRDQEIEAELLRTYVEAGNVAEARGWARAPADYRVIASALADRGEAQASLEVLQHAIARFPDDTELRTAIARALLAQGDVARAAEFFDGDASHPVLSLRIAETHLVAGRIDEALGLLRRLLEDDPQQRDPVALLAWDLETRSTAATFAVIELAVEVAVAQRDHNWGALALQEFVRRTPGHVPALLRLVEVCVDGGLDGTTPIAQAQLADAYLDAGAAARARVIAEALAVRNPSNAAHVDRLRRALEMAGEPDPESVIADLLTAAPATDDGERDDEIPPGPEPAAHADAELDAEADADMMDVETQTADIPRDAGEAAPDRGDTAPFDLSASAVDIEALLRELEGPPSPPAAVPPNMEVDLSIVLDTIKPGAPPLPQLAPLSADETPSADLDAVFGQLRRDAAARRPTDTAEADYARGTALFEAGDLDGALEALEAAAIAPSLRFRAASLAARICRTKGRGVLAIDWLEKAAEAAAPAVEQAHAVLYELADLLESEGEAARALAVCLELQAEAGEYRDVSARVGRLARVTARG